MILKVKFFYFCLILIFASNKMMSQDDCSREDYGKFCISFSFDAVLSLQLYNLPNDKAKPIAQLDVYNKQNGPNSYISGASTVHYYKNKQVINDKAVLGLINGETNGLAGLAYSSDSEWVQISLDYMNISSPSTCWIKIEDVKNAGASIFSWKEFFREMSSLYFKCDSTMRFYSEASVNTRIYPVLQKDEYGKCDYDMEPIQISGAWMQVYLNIPSYFLESILGQPHSSNLPHKVWIKYLNDNGRPQVWYNWE